MKWLTVNLSLLAEGESPIGILGIDVDDIGGGSAHVTRVYDDSPASKAKFLPDMIIEAIQVIKPGAARIEYDVPETKEQFSQILRDARASGASELRFKVRCAIII